MSCGRLVGVGQQLEQRLLHLRCRCEHFLCLRANYRSGVKRFGAAAGREGSCLRGDPHDREQPCDRSLPYQRCKIDDKLTEHLDEGCSSAEGQAAERK